MYKRQVYGIGTELVASADSPSLGGVYKLVEITREGRTTPIAKFSADKATWPGAHQVWRHRDASGRYAGDVLALDVELPDEVRWRGFEPPQGPRDGDAAAEALLSPMMTRGARISPPEALEVVRARVKRGLDAIPVALLSLEDGPERYPVVASARLLALAAEVKEHTVAR